MYRLPNVSEVFFFNFFLFIQNFYFFKIVENDENIQQDAPEHKYSIKNGNGWEQMSDLWPKTKADQCDENAFLYLTLTTDALGDQKSFKINTETISKIPNMKSLMLRFNYWIRSNIPLTENHLDLIIGDKKTGKINLLQR